MQETWVQSLGWEDPVEKGRTTHSSILAWAGHDRAIFTFASWQYHIYDVLFFSVHLGGRSWCWHVLLLVMLTLIFWLSCCLPGFSLGSCYLLLWGDKYLAGDTWRLCKSFLFRLSLLTSIHHGSCLQQSSLCCSPKGDALSFFCIYWLEFCYEEELLSSPPPSYVFDSLY